MPNRRLRVFVSHANGDVNREQKRFRELARALFERLKLDVDIQDEGLPTGPLRETILKRLKTCDYHVIILTPTSMDRPWVLFEWGAGMMLHQNTEHLILLAAEAVKKMDRLKPDVFVGWTYVPWGEDVVPETVDNISVWSRTFDKETHVINRLSETLFTQTFEGKNLRALEYSAKNKRGLFTKQNYEDWLEIFGAWARKQIDVASRQHPKYWLRNVYPNTIREQIREGVHVRRSNLWTPSSLASTQLSREKKEYLSEKLQQSYNFECDVCNLQYLLEYFRRYYHYPDTESYYAFYQYLPALQSEFGDVSERIIYDEKFVLEAKFNDDAGISYSMRVGSNETIRLVDLIKDGTFQHNAVEMIFPKGLKISAPVCGSVDALISSLRTHNQTGSCGKVM